MSLKTNETRFALVLHRHPFSEWKKRKGGAANEIAASTFCVCFYSYFQNSNLRGPATHFGGIYFWNVFSNLGVKGADEALDRFSSPQRHGGTESSVLGKDVVGAVGVGLDGWW